MFMRSKYPVQVVLILSMAICGLMNLAVYGQLIEPNADAVYYEENGIIVMEAESVPHNTTYWSLETSIAGYRGTGYLVGKSNHYNSGGRGTLTYPIVVANSGRYQLAWKSRITEGTSHTDFNDSFGRMLDSSKQFIYPVSNQNVKKGGDWFKVYMNRVGSWSYDASNRDNDPHSLSWELEAGRTYYFEMSVRSKGHGVDRIFLWDRAKYSYANLVTAKSGNGTALDAYPQSRREGESDGDLDSDGLPDEWESANGTSNTSIDPDSDDDRDGLPAAVEFSIGTSPKQFTSLPEASLVSEGGVLYYNYDFTESVEATELFDLAVQYSSDMGAWSEEGLSLIHI